MKKRSLNKIKQMVSIGMSCIMAGSTCNLPMMLHAEEVQTENMHPTYMVTSFDELNEEIAYQALSIGAEESEINFPDTLKVKVIRQVEEEPSTEADEEESSTEAVEEEASTEAEEETASKALESQTEAESQTESESEVESGTETEVKPQTEVESQTEIESELRTEVELLTEVENETLESESETEVPMTETEVPETTAASEPQTQVPETTVSESETESTEQLESDTTEEESSIVASLIDSIKGLFAPVEVYAAEEHLTYSAGEGNGAEDSQEGEEWTIEHITWKLDAEKSSLPEFDSSEESAGAVYIYTPTIPETDEKGNHYILSEEAILPEIYVMVDCVDNGIVLYSSNIVDSGTCGAEGNNGDNLTWILDDEGVLTISGTGAMASWNWNKKDSPWYANKDKIESVMIEDGVTSIGIAAFSDCSSLASITLPNSIRSIGGYVFKNCSSLTSITIPNSVPSIGSYAFSGCSNLASITISNSVKSIRGYVFENCSSLKSITIPNSVTSIGNIAFYNCSSLKSITIPNSVTSIGDSAFKNCSSLTSVIYLGTTEQWNAIKKGRYALSSEQLKNVKCHEHSHTLAWSNNDTYHWHQCTDEACPVKDEPQAQDSCALHKWENGICSVCQYSCKHTGAEEWVQTAKTHKKKWSCCNLVTVKEVEHNWENGKCSVCGYICKHTGAEEWTQTEKTHEKKWNCCNLVTVKEEVHEWKDGVCEECEYVCQHKNDNHDHLCDTCNKKVSEHTGGTATCKDPAICDICKQPYGEVDSNNHAGAEKWTQTAEKHEKKCNKCGVVTVAEKEHDWKNGTCSECGYICKHTGGTATCTEKAVCTICKQPYGKVDSSKHTGTEEWTQTEKTHEKKWNCCNLVTVKKEVHEWKDGTCEECGYACQHKDDNHDHFCDICNKKVSEHTGGTATCIAKAVCTICKQPYGKVDSSNHTGTEEWTQTAEKHKKKWSCCNLVTVAEEEHEWKDGVCEECEYVCQHKNDNNDHLCDICDEKVSDHTGGTATCTAKAVCTICNQPYG